MTNEPRTKEEAIVRALEINCPFASPSELQWIEGELPPPESVPYESMALVWMVADKDATVGYCNKGGGYSYEKAPELAGTFSTIGIAHEVPRKKPRILMRGGMRS